MHKLNNKQLGILAIVLLVLFLIVLAFSRVATLQESGTGTISTASAVLPQSAPQPAQLQQLQANPTFQYVISYTDQGFEPQTLTVKTGNTVRFTNNSSGQLWVAALGEDDSPIYPGTSACGGSSFDSCGAFPKSSFWQFTFTQIGTYYFQNNADATKSGEIIVTAQ